MPPKLSEYWDVNQGSSSPETIWDAFKVFTRGQYMCSISAFHRDLGATIQSLQTFMATHSEAYDDITDADNFIHLQASQRELNLHLAKLTRLEQYRTRQPFFFPTMYFICKFQ